MSAFIVSDLHILTIAEFIAKRFPEWRGIDRQQLAQDLANRLKRVNIESVNHRYSEKTPRTKCKPQAVTITDPAKVYRLVRCWTYQASENTQSVDFHALNALIDAAFTQDEKRSSDNVSDSFWTI